MPSIQEIRQKFPQYNDLDDGQLLDGLYSKFYSDLERGEFEKRLGVSNNEQGLSLERQQAIQNVDEMASTVNEYLPGRATQKGMEAILPEAATKYMQPITQVADEGLRQYGNALYGAARGVPVAGAYLDEAIAGISSIFGGDYDKNLEHMRALDDVSERDYGAANMYGKVAGGLSAGYGLGGQIVKGAQPLLATIGKSALAGAGIGAAHEFGEGEGFKDRVERGGYGAAFGGVVGGGLPALGGSVSKVAAPLINKYSGQKLAQIGQSADEAADAILARRMGAQGVDDARVALAGGRRSARLDSNSVAELPETIADTSDEMQRLLGSIYRNGGKPGEFVHDVLQARQRGVVDPMQRTQTPGPKGQYRNIMDAVERALKIKTQKGSYARTKDIKAKQAREGYVFYNAAFKEADDFQINDEIASTMDYARTQRGKIGKSLRKAAKYFAGDKNTAPVRTLKDFDNAKKALDDDIMRAKGNQKRELVAFKNRLLDRVHGGYDEAGNPLKNAAYQKARDAWGGHAQAQEAIDMGRDALRNETDDIVAQFRELSPGDKVLFRVGLRDAFKKALRTKTPGNDISLMFEKNHVRELMAEVIPQSRNIKATFGDRAARFGDFVKRQRNMNETNKKALGGSPTVQKYMDQKSFEGDVFDAVAGVTRSLNPTDNIIAALGSWLKTTAKIKEPVARKMAEKLLESDPAKQRVILRKLLKKMGHNRYSQFIEEWDRVMSGLGVTIISSEKD